MSTQSNISRRMSQSAVIQAIASFGPVSRASVAKITGLSKQTVSEIVGNLENEGWVREVGQTEGHIGRRAVVYEIAPSAASIASVDLGGTKVRVALCDLTGRVLAERVEPTEPTGGMDVVAQIARLVQAAASDAVGGVEKLHTAVVGVPGVPDPASGAILLAPNIAGIDQIDLAGALRDMLGVEVFVENDVNLAALGEHWLGSRGEGEDLVFISVGTGIGAGIVMGGQLLRGHSGAAGEIGFLPFGADPFEPESLSTGALERVAATEAIVGQYRALKGRELDVPGVFDAAADGDQAAIETLDAVARQIARAIAAMVAIVDPSVVVIGGSIGARTELLDRVRGCVAQCYPRPVTVEKSTLGDHAALAGGASIALSHLHISLFAEGQSGARIAVPPPAIADFKAGAS
ncbi:ROK family transcriptional regulator [Tritonibacter horizontis]|uniref:N-acetylglucosamine repressor n=1 Tax=Tritonibacter horizontis TaxID=1768241 RepID=A0A132BT65_9RHOB|nr:ROK family transcriptional regulator [Tritonibacter horizontis]KUP91571.1 N-acetylglucosamine repressor [Tritonibacter horizontis]